MKAVLKFFMCIVGIIIFGGIVNFAIKKTILKDYKIIKNKNIVVFGDSHAESDFNGADINIQNFGYRTETPNFTLLKMKHLFNNVNDSEKTVIVVVSPHNISKWYELRSFQLDSSASRLSRFWNVIDNSLIYKDYLELPFRTQLTLHTKKLFGSPSVDGSFKFKSTFKGGFYKNKDTTVVTIEQAKKANEKHFGNIDFVLRNNKSEKLTEMYYDMFSFLKQKNLRVIVIGSPLHSNYRNLLTKEQVFNYDLFLNEIEGNYSNVKVLNFSKLEIPNKYFLDTDHLNILGEVYFTNIVKNKINSLLTGA